MLKIKRQLSDDIEAYCKLNDIKDPELFCNNMLEKAFMVIKYPAVPDITIVEKPAKKEEENVAQTQHKVPENALMIKKSNTKDDYEIYDDI